MRSLKYFLMILAFVLFPVFAFAQEPAPMRLSLSQGVELMSKGGSWVQADMNSPMAAGDRIWASAGGRAEIQIPGGAYVRLEGDGSLDVLRSSSDSAQFYTEGGHVYVNNRRAGLSVVQVDTPLASIRAYGASAFFIDAEDNSTVLQVLEGDVYAENMQGQTRVATGNALTIREDGSAELSPIGEADEWDRWNIERDKALSAWGESTRYLPDELHGYSADFDNYGRWGYDYTYGYVWFPMAGPGWAPYRAGMWQWIGGSFVWISFEPWGWAPYHYGRWQFIAGRGWCWVPPGPNGVFWGPGYVGWVRTGPFIGWVPLAPGEIYYGYCNCGPYSVNIVNIDPRTIPVRKFRNADSPNGATFIRRDMLGTRQSRFIAPPANPFTAPRFDFRPPRSAPGAGITTGRQIPIGQRPPERVINITPEKLIQQRRLVREPGQSVFMERPRQLRPRRTNEPKSIKRKMREERKGERGEEGRP